MNIFTKLSIRIDFITLEYLGFQLYSKLTGEARGSKVLKKINAKLKTLYQKSRYLTPAYKCAYAMHYFSHISIMDVPYGFLF